MKRSRKRKNDEVEEEGGGEEKAEESIRKKKEEKRRKKKKRKRKKNQTSSSRIKQRRGKRRSWYCTSRGQRGGSAICATPPLKVTNARDPPSDVGISSVAGPTARNARPSTRRLR